MNDLTTNLAEAVAWGMRDKTTGLILDVICPDEHDSFEGDYTVPLFAAPVAQAEPFTAAQLMRLYNNLPPSIQMDAQSRSAFVRIARAIETAHGIKEKP